MTTHGRAPTGGDAAASSRPAATGASRFTSRRIVALVLLVLAIVFVVENRQLTEIRLLIPVVFMPLWAALTITLVIGLIVGVVFGRRRK